MSELQDTSGLEQQFLHVKDIEIDFKGNRPKYPISVKLKVDKETREKSLFKKDEVVHWDFDENLRLSAPNGFTIVVEEVHKFHRKKDFAVFVVKPKDLVGKDTFSIEDKKGRALVKLTYDLVLPSHGSAEQALKEAQAKLENKKVFLESLGKARHALDFLMKFTDLAADVHPAINAAVTIVNTLYERCKEQEDCRDVATHLMKDLVSFLPFIELVDTPSELVTKELMRNKTAQQTLKEILKLFHAVSEFILQYSSSSILGDLLSSQKDKFDAWKADFSRSKSIYDWCLKIETWRSVIETGKIAEDQVLRQLHPAQNAYFNEEKACLEGTRLDIFEQVTKWADSDSHMFWLHGLAGSGKSSIAHSIAHMFDQQGRLPGCFFFQRDDEKCRNPQRVIPTLAYHLSRWHAGYRNAILSVLQGVNAPKLAQGLQRQYELLLEKPLQSLEHIPADLPPRPMIVVIDALDECDDTDRSKSQLVKQILSRD